MTKTVAVTGAGGFVGSRLVSGLSRSGWHVYAITSHKENVPVSPNVTVINSHWTLEGIKSAFLQAQDAALWIHAAARIQFADENIFGLYHDNALLTEFLARLIGSLGSKNLLIYLSSISVYSQSQEPTIDVEPRPDTHYGLSKLLGERLSQAHLGDHCVVLRLSGVWGAERNPKLFINRCLQQAQEGHTLVVRGRGLSRRNYLWVGDLEKIVNLAYTARWHGIKLVAGPEPVSMRRMVETIGAKYKVSVRFVHENDNQTEQDIIVEVLPDLPTTCFEDALLIEL